MKNLQNWIGAWKGSVGDGPSGGCARRVLTSNLPLQQSNHEKTAMTKEENWGDDCFCCHACGKLFRSPLYDVTREYERTEFYSEPRMPEVEIMGAETIRNYCSAICRDSGRQEFLRQERIRATFPDIGPIESCSRCNGPVDMTEFHLTYIQTLTEQNWERPMFGVEVLDVKTIAAVCQKCEPIRRKISDAIEWDVKHSVAISGKPR